MQCGLFAPSDGISLGTVSSPTRRDADARAVSTSRAQLVIKAYRRPCPPVTPSHTLGRPDRRICAGPASHRREMTSDSSHCVVVLLASVRVDAAALSTALGALRAPTGICVFYRRRDHDSYSCRCQRHYWRHISGSRIRGPSSRARHGHLDGVQSIAVQSVILSNHAGSRQATSTRTEYVQATPPHEHDHGVVTRSGWSCRNSRRCRRAAFRHGVLLLLIMLER
ncbi:hypothetical protein GY45DRAFT_419319 [Cubamyces sp. BRFM 1775]|nr:hypothetical protein GY45DRAFT_419319 [Cubamyces sp. BRFM 1775]